MGFFPHCLALMRKNALIKQRALWPTLLELLLPVVL
jgi:hypothetical protein